MPSKKFPGMNRPKYIMIGDPIVVDDDGTTWQLEGQVKCGLTAEETADIEAFTTPTEENDLLAYRTDLAKRMAQYLPKEDYPKGQIDPRVARCSSYITPGSQQKNDEQINAIIDLKFADEFDEYRERIKGSQSFTVVPLALFAHSRKFRFVDEAGKVVEDGVDYSDWTEDDLKDPDQFPPELVVQLSAFGGAEKAGTTLRRYLDKSVAHDDCVGRFCHEKMIIVEDNAPKNEETEIDPDSIVGNGKGKAMKFKHRQPQSTTKGFS